MKKVKNIAIKVASKATIVTAAAGGLLFGMPSAVAAEDCGLLPCFISNIMTEMGIDPGGKINSDILEGYLNDRVRIALTFLFVVVFIVAIVFSALAGIKFMSSQGDSGKLEESKGAVKAILMGFAAMLVAIIGIFIVLWLLGSESAPPSEFNLEGV